MINRFSSRRQRLDRSFLAERLRGAQGYDRIAGFFSSSILGVAGEELESISGPVRLVCNSSLDPKDIETAKQAAQAALRREWCDAEPERLPDAAKPRFQRLYDFLASGKLQVRVLPDAIFCLIHGKAGVITLADGRKTAFLGSVNESLTAWRLNYELLWEDDYENGIEYPTTGPESIRKCPRRVGIVSTGLIIAGSEISDWLINGRYECVILDEAHRARRRNLGSGKEYDPAEPNKLLRFLWDISPRTRSLLLATATPVQLHPIEASLPLT